MNVFAELDIHIADALTALEKAGILPGGSGMRKLRVEPSRKPGYGDFTSKAALLLASAARLPPSDLARLVAARLEALSGVEKVEIAGPGFINLTMTSAFWTGALAGMLASGPAYGRGVRRPDGAISVGCMAHGPIESIGPNHIRPILTADALANLLDFAGWRTCRELVVGAPRSSTTVLQADLSALRVHHDIVFFEQSQQESGNDIQAATAPPDFKSGFSTSGSAMDHALIKSNGGFTTFEFQLAYYRDRLVRGFKRMITVLGANHSVPTETLAAIQAFAAEGVDLQTIICQPMRINGDGPPQQSRRTDRPHNRLSAASAAAKVGSDSLRYMTLFSPHTVALELDVENIADQSWNNPVFYVQYAHARACSALRNLKEACPGLQAGEKELHASHLHLLTHETELSVIKRLSQFPRVIEFAADRYEPQRIAFFLYELASAFHELWNRSKESPQLQFNVLTDRELLGARVALVAAAARTLQTGLGLLGVNAVSEMR